MSERERTGDVFGRGLVNREASDGAADVNKFSGVKSSNNGVGIGIGKNEATSFFQFGLLRRLSCALPPGIRLRLSTQKAGIESRGGRADQRRFQ